MTEAAFTSFIRSKLRSASLRWPPKNEVLKKARKNRGFYECACCKQVVPLSLKIEGKGKRNVEVNHKVPVTLPGEWDGWDNFINRLFVEEPGLEVLCSSCHHNHTQLLRSLKEEWKEVIHNPNYEVSSFGRVRHKINGLRKLVKDTHYLRVRMWKPLEKEYQLFMVHRLVAEAFLPNHDNLPEVNHKDGYKLNNFLHNLEWVSRKDNAKHAGETGLMPTGVGHHSHIGLWFTPFGTFESLDEAAKNCPLSRSKLYKLCKDPNNDDYGVITPNNKKEQDEL